MTTLESEYSPPDEWADPIATSLLPSCQRCPERPLQVGKNADASHLSSLRLVTLAGMQDCQAGQPAVQRMGVRQGCPSAQHPSVEDLTVQKLDLVRSQPPALVSEFHGCTEQQKIDESRCMHCGMEAMQSKFQLNAYV